MEAKSLSEYSERLEQFYIALAEAAKGQGYYVDYIKAEAPPCDNQGELLSRPQLQTIYGNDMPEDWKGKYSTFLEDDECLKNTLGSIVASKGQDVAFNFTAPDAFLGNVAVRVEDKWFAVGECRNCSTPFPFEESDEFSLESANICIMKIWSPFYVLSRIEHMEVQLEYAKITSAGQVY